MPSSQRTASPHHSNYPSHPGRNSKIAGFHLVNKKTAETSSPFDAETEESFWREQHKEIVTTLKSALLLGAAGFLAFLVLDIFTKDLSFSQSVFRSLIVFALGGLFIHLENHPQAHTQISQVVKISVSLSTLNLLCVLMVEDSPDIYIEIWPALLPIYFFTYGQTMLPIVETIAFGWLSTLIFPIAGYYIGAEWATLVPSLIILSIANLFGLCTRYQLERHSRNSYIGRLKAEQAVKEKTLFLRQLSHNLRQPLQALSCHATVLENGLSDNESEILHRSAEKIGLTIDELNNTFSRILDIDNLEKGSQRPIITGVGINLLLINLENQYAQQAEQQGLKLKVVLRTQPPFTVLSDVNILKQILSNLLSNAVKYTPKGWILVKTVKTRDHQLKLHIIDTGLGIADEQQKLIFKEFYRGGHIRRLTDRHVSGLGIGLDYVMTATKRLPNHELKLYSKPNRGSDFQLRLPVAINSSNPDPTADNIPNNLQGNFILVVEDDVEVLDALAEQLSSWGCIVQKAQSLAETLDLLAENIRPPDLLITDFFLKNKETAHDIIAAIDTECGPVPTLVLSAHAISESEKAQMPANTQLLRKPASAAALMETMAKAMGK